MIHPEWQDIRVGDTVWLARSYGEVARQVIAAVEPESHLVLMSPDDFERVQRGEKASGAWGFHLRRKTVGPAWWPAAVAAPSDMPLSTYRTSSWNRK